MSKTTIGRNVRLLFQSVTVGRSATHPHKRFVAKFIPPSLFDLAFQADLLLCCKDLRKLISISLKLDINLNISITDNRFLVKKQITDYYYKNILYGNEKENEKYEKLINFISLIVVDDEAHGADQAETNENRAILNDNVKGIAFAAAVGCAAVGLAPVALSAAGFTAGGIAAGSVAAAVQSSVYGGATCGVLAALQSAGAAGLAASSQACIFGGSAGLANLIWRQSLSENHDDPPDIWDLAFQIDQILCATDLEKMKKILFKLHLDLDASIEEYKFLAKKQITEHYEKILFDNNSSDIIKKEKLFELIRLITVDQESEGASHGETNEKEN